MSDNDVVRWEMVWSYWPHDGHEMEPDTDGDFVKYEDYAALRDQLTTARTDALEEAAKVADPGRDEPSVDWSNQGDIEERADWACGVSLARAIRALITKETE